MAHRGLMDRALRSGMAGFAVGAALVALGAATAQGLSTFNTDAPVMVDATGAVSTGSATPGAATAAG